IARAEKDGSALPEIHQHDNRKFLTVVKPLQDRNRTIGTLLVSFDFSQLQALMPALEDKLGYVEVIQTFSGQPTVVFSSGNSAHKLGSGHLAQSDIPHFSARFYPAPETDIFSTSAGLLWGIVGAAAVITALLGLVSYLLLNKALQANATAMASRFQAMTLR